jgi:drug/metabolite transporter (DMT)-like permease
MELHQATKNWRLGLGLSSIASILWGLVPIALSIVSNTLDIYTINWFRFITAFFLLGCYLAKQRNIPKITQLKVVPIYVFAIASLGLAGNYIFFVMGVRMTSPSHAEVLTQLAGVFLSLGGIVIFKECYTRYQWMGVGILTTGFIGFFYEQLKVFTTQNEQYISGSLISIVAALSWVVYALIQKQLLTKLDSEHIMWIIYGVCGLLFWTMAKPQTLIQLNAIEWAALIFCGLNTTIAYGAFAESLQHWEASRVSAILALAPIFTIGSMSVIAWLFPGLVTPEHLTLFGLIGAILVVTGSISIALGKS